MLSACATPKHNYTAMVIETKTQPSQEVKLAAPGQTVLFSKRSKEQESLYLTAIVKIGLYTLSNGYYNKEGDDEGAEYFYPAGGNEAGKVSKVIIADPWKSVMAPRGGGKLCVVTIFNAKACSATAAFEHRKLPIPFEDAYEKTLTYVGAKANHALFNYKETKNGVLIAGSSKDLEYDLSASKIVEFGSVKIEVQSATPGQLIYRIL